MKFYQIICTIILGLALSLTGISYVNSQIPIVLYETIEYPVQANKYCDLSKKVDETSGLILMDGQLWTFNDSFGKPEIYAIDKESGKVVKIVEIQNAENYDWEGIAMDEDFIYVGDFGNNYGTRKDLKIFKINKSDISENRKNKVEAELITFSYNDQESFEKKNRKHNYDCESMISYQDSLIIFSKNWGNGKTRMYILPKEPGDYKLDPVSYFDVDGLVTGADYNENTNDLLIIGYKDYVPFVFLFKDFTGQTLSLKKVYRINLPGMKNSQTEGITWVGENKFIFSTEQTSEFEQAAYLLDISKVFKLANIEED